jgi:ferrochelatase
VGIYLKEFLMDPLVIDIPYLARWILVNWLVIPKRKIASAKLYENIWSDGDRRYFFIPKI